MQRPASLVFLLFLVAVLAAGTWVWRWKQGEQAAAPRQPAAPQPVTSASLPARPVAVAEAPPLPPDPLAARDVPAALEDLVGRKAVTSHLQLDDFPRRVVATVDNLGRSHAPPALWPLYPAGARFTVDASGGAPVIARDNASRYVPLVLLAESIDAATAAQLYQRMYPLLQREYRQLGYPDGSFHRRLMEVIEQLLATPEPQQPPRLQLVEVKGPVPSERPWVRYEYADPALENLSAGQKILLRVGLANERRLKKKLAEFRDALRKRPDTR